MARFVLSHRHRHHECRTAYAAWNGFESPLRQRDTVASCASGGHAMFWTVDARDEHEALAQLPPFLADRTEVIRVTEVAIP